VWPISAPVSGCGLAVARRVAGIELVLVEIDAALATLRAPTRMPMRFTLM
jgi:hypothetical protein